MDVSVQIKNNLISRIKSSTDLDFLKALQTIFDSSEKELYMLNNAQESSIEQARRNILLGKVKPHNKVMQETKEWLKNM